VKDSQSLEKGCLLASDVDSVVLPINACAGDGALAFARSKINKVDIIICFLHFPYIKKKKTGKEK
jgi:hypothetical protein